MPYCLSSDLSTMPPSKDCRIEHIKRENYQVRIWRLANIAFSAFKNHVKDMTGQSINGELVWVN